jgi:hypothetical protein
MRKRITILLILLTVVTAAYAGTKMVYNVTHRGKVTFLSFASGTTTPAATVRTLKTFTAEDAANIFVATKEEWNNAVIRCMSTTDADSTVFDMFTAGDEGHFTRKATLTFTTGTQTAGHSGYEYADTVVITNEKHPTDIVPVSPVGNYIAEVYLDLHDARYVGFSPTTITNAAKIEIVGY